MNSQIVIIFLVIVAYMLKAPADAINHDKGAKKLLELWHILMFTSYAILISIILYLMKVSVLVWILLLAILWVWWALIFKASRKLKIWRWDDKLKIPLLRKIWDF